MQRFGHLSASHSPQHTPATGRLTAWRRGLIFVAACLLALTMAACGDSSDSKDSTPGGTLTCGNQRVDAAEVCDGAQLNAASCESLGFSGGTLGCKSNCAGYDLSGCDAPLSCGDGEVQAIETCDGAALGGQTCAGLGFDGGTLTCAANCLDFDTSACTRTEPGPNNNTPSCTPKTCAGLDAQCGTTDDGCGQTLDCGGCADGLSCGGGGTPNVCGAPCEPACPAGYTCSNFGFCEGGAPLQLVLDVPLAVLTVSAAINGAPIRASSSCDSGALEVRLRDLDRVNYEDWSLPCYGSALHVTVPHGRYQVIAVPHPRSATNLPDFRPYPVLDELVVDADRPVALDVLTADVSVRVTANGAALQASSNCSSSLAKLRFEYAFYGNSEDWTVPCDASPVTMTIPQTTYNVVVITRLNAAQKLPGTIPYQAASRLLIKPRR